MSLPRWLLALAALSGAAAAVLGLVRDWPLALTVLTGAMAATSVLLLAQPAGRTASRRSAAYALLVVGLVQLPLAFSIFDPEGVVTSLGALDFAGALGFAVPVGAGMYAWSRVRATGSGAIPAATPDRGRLTSGRLAPGTALAALGLVAICIAAETVIDDVTPRIFLSATLSAVTGCAGWVVTRLISTGRPTARDAVYGVLAGLVSALASSAWVTVQWSLLIGVAAGALSAVFYGFASRGMGERQAAIAVLLLVGGAAGCVMLGLFTDGTGLVHTGGITQLAAQLGATILAVAWSMVIAEAAGFALKPRHVERPDEVGDTGLEPMTSSV
ncbi:MAG: hypothetical protein ABWX59_04425 [Microbacteriaceae bacterium]